MFKVDKILSGKKPKRPNDCALYSLLCFFVLMKSYCKKNKKFKTDLINYNLNNLITIYITTNVVST